MYLINCYSNTLAGLAWRGTSLTKSSCAGERCFLSQALVSVPSWRFLSPQPASWALCVPEPVEPAGLVCSTLRMTNPRAGDLQGSTAVARSVLIAAASHPPRPFAWRINHCGKISSGSSSVWLCSPHRGVICAPHSQQQALCHGAAQTPQAQSSCAHPELLSAARFMNLHLQHPQASPRSWNSAQSGLGSPPQTSTAARVALSVPQGAGSCNL